MPEFSDRQQQIMATFNTQGNETLPGRMGIKIIEASPERVVGTMPVEGNTQPYGILHGGASCVLAESLGSLGSALQAGPGRFTVGIEINATHHRSVRSGLRHWHRDARPWRPDDGHVRHRHYGRRRQARLHCAAELLAQRRGAG